MVFVFLAAGKMPVDGKCQLKQLDSIMGYIRRIHEPSAGLVGYGAVSFPCHLL